MCRARAEVPVLLPWGLRCPRGQTLLSGTQQCARRRLSHQHSRSYLEPGTVLGPIALLRKQKGCVGVSDLCCLPESEMALVSAPQHSRAGSGVGAGMASDKAPEDCGSKNP